MLKKLAAVLLIFAAIAIRAVTGSVAVIEPAHAQDALPTTTPNSNNFTVSIEITGIVATVTLQADKSYLVTLQDGTTFIANGATRGNATVVPGQAVILVAELSGTSDQGPLIAITLDNAITFAVTPTTAA